MSPLPWHLSTLVIFCRYGKAWNKSILPLLNWSIQFLWLLNLCLCLPWIFTKWDVTAARWQDYYTPMRNNTIRWANTRRFADSLWINSWQDETTVQARTMKNQYVHKHIRNSVQSCNSSTKSELWKPGCIMLHCAVSVTAVHLSCLRCRAHCLFPLACNCGATVSLVGVWGSQMQTAQGGRCLAFLWMPSINWWQMSGLFLDGNTSSCSPVLPPRPTGHTSLLGRRSIQPHCTSPIPSCHT